MRTLAQLARNLRDSVAGGATRPALVGELDRIAQRRLGRGLQLWHLASGGCGACELELRALEGVAYDLGRLGLCFAASPRHADVLLVTGPVTRAMHGPALRTWEAMPDPKWVVAVGACAIDGGPFRGSYAVLGGADKALPVHLAVEGCPPDPETILSGLCALLDSDARSGFP